MNETAQFVIKHGYAVLFFWILAEQAALPIPSIPLLLVCGALVKTGHLNAGAVVAYGLVACLISDSVWFEVGRRRGSRVLGFLCRMALEPDSCVRQTRNGFAKYGVKSLLVSKFVPGMNAVAAPLAGSARTGWVRFLLFDTLGAALWISALAALGYGFSEELEAVGQVIGRAGFRLFLSIVLTIAAWIGWKYLQRKLFMRKLKIARIPAVELRRMLDDGEEPVIIDVRGGQLIDDPIPGAQRIPLSEIEKRHGEVPRDRDVILFCT
jgi:membrane protein DedA with SNARE-associated domain